MSQGNLDWTNRTTEDAMHVDEQVDGLIKSFGLQIILEAILHRIDVLEQNMDKCSKEDIEHFHGLRANINKALEVYKNRYDK